MHAIRQAMRIPPILYKPFHYTACFQWENLKNQSIVGMSKFSQLWHMLTTSPREHLKNDNESVTSDILVALCEGCGHRLDLHLKPLEEVG
jgi:hypothetical protein